MRGNDQESAGDDNGGAKGLCTWMLELIKEGGAVITQSEIHSSHFSTPDSEVHGTWRINVLLCRGL